MGCKKYLVPVFFMLLAFGVVYAQEEGAPKPPAEVPLEANENLDNLQFKNSQVSGFSVTGSGILTAMPDNAFIQLTMKSNPGPNLKTGETDVNQKVEFMIRGLCREFKLKKENFSMTGGGTQMQERTRKGVSADDQYDSDGTIIPKKTYSNTVKKTIIVNELGKKKTAEIMGIIDAAATYGATAIVSLIEEDTVKESVVSFGKSSAKSQALKGASGLKINADIKDPSNQLINYHFKEETLKGLLKQARDASFKEIKEKLAKAREKAKINDAEFDIDVKEDNNLSATEDGEVIIRTDITVTYAKPLPKE